MDLPHNKNQKYLKSKNWFRIKSKNHLFLINNILVTDISHASYKRNAYNTFEHVYWDNNMYISFKKFKKGS